MKLFYSLLFLMGALLSASAQTNYLIINPEIVLSKDSVQRELLIHSLNEFIISARKPNSENQRVLESQKLETYILLDEIRGIEKSKTFNDTVFYKPYLSNVSSLNDSQYLIQFSFIGKRDETVFLRAVYTIIGHRINGNYRFSSPLILNTKKWKVKKSGSTLFYYQDKINKANVKKFNKLASMYDAKLNSKEKQCEFYCCANMSELLKLIGVDYKSDYNGRARGAFSVLSGNKKLVILGNNNASFDEFDPHDLWHDRLSLVVPRNKVNRAVDEGCAYLYGGSWGLPWKDIFKAFKEQIASNENTNWVELKENPVYFTTKEYENSADYIVNALLIKKIERESGFEGVWELLNTGPAEEGNEKYYSVLEKYTGITKSNYNQKVWELIRSEQ